MREVAILYAKKQKYLEAITTWQNRRTHTLEDVRKIYGKLLHASLVVTAGRAYLIRLEAMLKLFDSHPFMPRTPPRGTAADLDWWRDKLSQPLLSRAIPGPCELHDPHAFSDASSGVGIGIVINGHWRAWRLLPGWDAEKRDIGWAEAVSFELLIQMLAPSAVPSLHG